MILDELSLGFSTCLYSSRIYVTSPGPPESWGWISLAVPPASRDGSDVLGERRKPSDRSNPQVVECSDGFPLVAL